jgi:hypothetical protein
MTLTDHWTNWFSAVIINSCTGWTRYTRHFWFYFCELHCVEKVRWKFQIVLRVSYTLQLYINVYTVLAPRHYLVYANNGKERRLAKYFLEPMLCVRQHAPGRPRFFSFWGRVGLLGFCCSQFCSHEIFTVSSSNLQVFNMFLKFPMCCPTCSQ